MNIERFYQLADVVERAGDGLPGFDMHSYFVCRSLRYADVPDLYVFSKECGATCCVAGFACLVWPSEVSEGDDPESKGADILGLTLQERGRLFYGGFRSTREQGAAHLRACAAAGEVLPWPVLAGFSE